MKLQFKEQDFQVHAVNAVVDCFKGQEMKTNRFTLERTIDIQRKAQALALGDTQTAFSLEEEVMENIGYRNRKIDITETQLLENINKVQQQNDIPLSNDIERPKAHNSGCNITIEMETGTGKTYTYIRTMYELQKHYGWTKYIIVVPSIAIREGVYKSFEQTRDHFQELYGHKIKPFIYNSASPQDIENFASDSRISVMIINTQAFNANPNAKGKDARRIHRELDQFGSRKPIDIIAQTNPILIIDEPQSVDGTKTLEGMTLFNPLFSLRYSATHKVEYNKVFRLDALDAYNRKLVKKIQVKGINIKGSTGTTGYLYLEQIELSKDKAPLAVVEFEKRSGTVVSRKRMKLPQGSNIYELSGEMPQYKNHTIQELDGAFNKMVINGKDIYAGEVVGNIDELTHRRIQIRETIISHLQKEKQLFDKGIKVLSLFFIDSVNNYRIYEENGEEQLGEYAKIFEEEYNLIRNEQFDLFQQEYNDYIRENPASMSHKGYMPKSYKDYLERDVVSKIHNGYFSIDKKNRLVDPNIKKGKDEISDDISAYELIMRDKERLLSFDEPTRFIFSHSALKEGWDNPNVFQICALKHSDNTTRRRQEVGRGMRLCVNGNGSRLDYQLLGDAVHDINKLTVVASESYEEFAKGLQSEIAATLKNRPQKAEVEYFVGREITDSIGSVVKIDKETAKKLNKYLYKHDIIDEDDRITKEGIDLIKAHKVPLPENLEVFRDDITKLLESIYTGSEFKPGNERDVISVGVNNNFHKKEFQDLWSRINQRTIYEVDFDSEKLIKDSINRLNADLYISDRKYEVKTGFLEESSKDKIDNKEAFKIEKIESKKLKSDIYTNAVYDIVGEIVNNTNLTRRTVVAVLKGVKEQQFLLIRKNPEEFIAKSSKLINEVKASLVINNIVYHKREERHNSKTVFTNSYTANRQENSLVKHIYDYLESDSGIETKFAEALECLEDVTVYAKLPKSFYITYPGVNGEAKYSPDWAIVFDREKVRNIYFVAETKGSESELDLRGIENLKIHCAKMHFQEIGDKQVKFDVVKDYEKLLEIVKES